jgi:hypothetical protein
MTLRLIPILALALLAGCDDPDDDAPVPGDPEFVRDPALDREVVSAHGGMTSHESGKNCMECHQKLGPGPGLFSVAGTVVRLDGSPSADATVELWTAPGGTGDLVLRVEADALGNFFTTEALDLASAPAFPFVKSADGVNANLMPFPTSSGACNVCHAGTGSNPVDLP